MKTRRVNMDSRIKPIGLGMVNAFLIRAGEGFILIDTGIPQQWTRLEAGLLSAGCLPGMLRLVVLTHGDYDHIGNCAELKIKYKARIAMHVADAHMAQTGKSGKRMIRSRTMRLISALLNFAGNLHGDGSRFRKFIPDVLLTDGQRLLEYGLDARIIHMPGHTKGSIAVLDGEGNLFTGDVLSNFSRPGISPYVDDLDAYRRSIDNIRMLDVKYVYPGHGKAFPADKVSAISV
jgi:hydroxyacylglutathione hydrolase